MKIRDIGMKATISYKFCPLSEMDYSIRQIYVNVANFTLLNFHLCSNIILKHGQKCVIYLELI